MLCVHVETLTVVSYLVTQHELGHNFGSSHDTTAACTPSCKNGAALGCVQHILCNCFWRRILSLGFTMQLAMEACMSCTPLLSMEAVHCRHFFAYSSYFILSLLLIATNTFELLISGSNNYLFSPCSISQISPIIAAHVRTHTHICRYMCKCVCVRVLAEP